jgi:hypothetical protein
VTNLNTKEKAQHLKFRFQGFKDPVNCSMLLGDLLAAMASVDGLQTINDQ